MTKFEESNYFLAASTGSANYLVIYKLNKTVGKI